MQILESFGTMSKIIGFSFYIFWDILNKMKDNFCQECGEGGFYPSRAKSEQ